jgi:HPt (histidine-containing phosphotransfer) domain-containing protein
LTVRKSEPLDIDDPFARQLVSRYLKKRSVDLHNLRDALDKEEFETIQTTGHNLYGSGSAYGLKEVSRIGKQLESSAEARDSRAIAQLLEELADLLDRIELS